MKFKKRYIVIGSLIFIYIVDIYIAKHINKELLANDYNFEERLAEVELNLETFEIKNTSSKCKLEYRFYFYVFQTCFKPITYSNDRNNHGYFFIYHKTKPKLAVFMPASSSDSYYFVELALGIRLFFIKRNGNIAKIKRYK